MEKASKNISVVEPTFSVRPPSNQEQIYCEICLKSCIKKHKLRSKLEKIVDIKTFELFAERWHQKQHEYNKVFNFDIGLMSKNIMPINHARNIFKRKLFEHTN